MAALRPGMDTMKSLVAGGLLAFVMLMATAAEAGRPDTAGGGKPGPGGSKVPPDPVGLPRQSLSAVAEQGVVERLRTRYLDSIQQVRCGDAMVRHTDRASQ